MKMSFSQLTNTMNLNYLKMVYHNLITNLFTLSLIPFIGLIIMMKAIQMKPQDIDIVCVMNIIICCKTIVFGITFYIMMKLRPIYSEDFTCYEPLPHLKAPFNGNFNQFSLNFQPRILEHSGLGEETYLLQAMHNINPPTPSMAVARDEAEQVMFVALNDLFTNTKVNLKDIKIVVVNCSLFNPTPSLTAMIVNRYKMGCDVRTFNLGSMGCSTGVSVNDLAKNMLQLHGNSYAVIVSTEITGNNRAMLIQHCLFHVVRS